MDSSFNKMSSYFFQKEEVRVLMQGFYAAGKTTVLYVMKLGEVVTTIPTIGFNVETIEFKNITITAWDAGGRDKIRPLWRHYYQNTHGIVCVVDSNDRDRVDEASRELHTMAYEDELRNIPILEPSSPRPTIQITTDKYLIYLDYNVITATTSIDQALCIVISLYVIFELQFGTHNRIIHLLYGILLQEPAALTKQLRCTLKEWKFLIEKKERKQTNQVVKITSTNNETHTTSITDLPHVDENEPDTLYDEEPNEDLTEKTSEFDPLVKVKQQLSVSTVSDDVQHPTTTAMTSANKYINNSSQKISLSSSTDPELQMHSSSIQELNIETSTPTLSNQNNFYSVNVEQKITRSRNRVQSTKPPTHTSPSTKPPNNISQSKKRRHSPERPISSRLKRMKQKDK
ncbi:unnamed protein product [Rotaria magnacalcarata]|uniref:ADP-ribosylation factor n=1 Tax=Rotaria magnacalcarata TaxID=392030 RepID=A0A816PED2_9BILA|nr:unnamed protein product [Rotaria magnacalcarata]